MSVTITFIENPFEPEKWEIVLTDDLLKCIVNKYDKWPETARLYRDTVAESNDITPNNEADVEALIGAQGEFFVVNNPAFGIDTLLYVALAASVVAAFVFKPKIPNQSQRAQIAKSPNNELSARVNNARPNARVPDIYGTVRSTPDLVTLPYTIYVANREVENATMCIGRGQYEILDSRDNTTPIHEIEGTDVNVWHPNHDVVNDAPDYIAGNRIYGPVLQLRRNDAVNGQTLKPSELKFIQGNENIGFASPNRIVPLTGSGVSFFGLFNPGDPITITGAQFTDESLLRSDMASVGRYYNGDPNAIAISIDSWTPPPWLTVGSVITIIAPDFGVQGVKNGISNDYFFNLNGDYTIVGVSTIYSTESGYHAVISLDNPGNSSAGWRDLQTMMAIYKVYPVLMKYDIDHQVRSYNLDGQYTVESVNAFTGEMTLVNPGSINGDWNLLPASPPNYISPFINNDAGMKWVGEFFIEDPQTTKILINVVAPNGLYGEIPDLVFPLFIVTYIEYWPVDEFGNRIGGTVRIESVIGDPIFEDKDQRGRTTELNVPANRYKVRVVRQTPKLDFLQNMSIVDEIKLKDLYYGREAPSFRYGDVTIVRSRTVATAGALSLKERKLNLLVTRQIPLRIDGNQFTSDLHSTNRADEIICAIALDPKIGRRSISEVDVNNIYSTIAQAENYFGFQKPIEFCYTFDEDGLTFEETIAAIAQSVFCVAYRQGSVLKLKFEGRTDDSTLLFNHRNKIPGSETRTVTFGPSKDYDGVAFSYVSPADDAVVTKYIPADRSARNEKKIESIGVRNDQQAHIHAWRHYQKLQYQNYTTEFQATEEAELLVLTDRILVADNTRPDTQDGEVMRATGLLVETSQEVSFEPGQTYTVFLQLYDGTVQALGCAEVPGDSYAIQIDSPPRYPLVFNDDRYAKTTYTIVRDDDPRQMAFILTERQSMENAISQIVAVNYSDKYYEHDNDFFPPIDRNIYFTSEPYYYDKYKDGFGINPLAQIRLSAAVPFEEANNFVYGIDQLLIEDVPVTGKASAEDAQNLVYGVDSVSFDNVYTPETKDGLAITPTAQISLPNLVSTAMKDAMPITPEARITLS